MEEGTETCLHRGMAVGATPARAPHQTLFDSSGRDRELRLAEGLLADGPVRLVTFTGPAGVGKTWTAHRVARRLEAHRGTPPVTASVHNVRGFEDLVRAVARAVDVPPSWAPLVDRLSAVVSRKPLLAVLDGCERLSGRPHPVAKLLSLCPSLRVVATSLRPLGVEGERVVGLDPLGVPPSTAGLDELRHSPAVQLFFKRAAESNHGFEPDTADATTIAELCRRVHGLPLGIEILATRAGADSPAALVGYLDSGQEVTSQRTPTSSGHRHLSLHSALAWSYAMLGPRAATLLRRMSVFASPATVDMIASVAGATSSDGAGSQSASQSSYAELLDTLSSLVDHRLVEPHEGPGEPGFVLVELIREFALEQLVEEGEQAAADEAHTRAVIDFALARSEGVEAFEDDVSQAELARSEADLRSVLRRLVGRADVEDGLLLATALAPFVLRRGYDGFVGPALTSLLRRARTRETDEVKLARATFWKAWLCAQFPEPEAADEVRTDLAEGLRLARRSGDSKTLLLGLSLAMQTLPVTGDTASAAAAAAEGLPLAEAIEAAGDHRWVARFCARAGIVALQTGRTEEALRLAARGLEGVEAGDARAQILLALLLSAVPQDRAAALMSRLPPVEELMRTARRLGDPRYEPPLVRAAGWLALREGDLPTAAARCADALRLAHRQAAWHDIPFAIVPLTMVAVRRRDLADAARLHGMVRSRLDVLRRALPPDRIESYLRSVDAARRTLGDAGFESLAERGEEEMRADALSGPLAYAESAAAVGRAGHPRVPAQPGDRDPDQLTPREQEVLSELVTGATNKEISHRLGMAPKTVMHHSVAIYRKLGVRGRAEATAWAFRHGLVD